MKKNPILWLALGGTLLAGCKKDFLDLSPQATSSAANFFQTQSQIEQAVNGAYVPLRDLTNLEYWVYGEMRSDNTSFQYNNTDRGQESQREFVDEFLVSANSESVLSYWQGSYRGISRCNDVLGHIDAVTMTADKKDQYTGEAKFLRAWYYYNLVRQYGGVPLRLESVASPAEAKSQGRATLEATYTQIVADLTDAAAKLPTKAAYAAVDAGRATKGAATALLASVYLTRKDYPNALTQLRAVRSAGYSLLSSYRSVFDPANKNNAESIFEVQYLGSQPALSSSFTYTFAPYTSSNFVTGDAATRNLNGSSGWNTPTPELINAYETGDLRKDASLQLGYKDATGTFVAQPYVSKYNFGIVAPGRTDTDFPVLRYADVLLMQAEVLNEQGYAAGGEAFDLLNQVRRRAGLPDKTAAAVSSQAAFRDAVLQERRVELAFENSAGTTWCAPAGP
ncbi:RagB/SusD family nutrient uptake outer membrane protein [Hymenobacter coccineus]|uniref:RagB/SusD family nutrient uptake outer membrane protein n=1 Tax=Hymenobacter coccineus TaxID=1908235 RepID=UPI0009F42452